MDPNSRACTANVAATSRIPRRQRAGLGEDGLAMAVSRGVWYRNGSGHSETSDQDVGNHFFLFGRFMGVGRSNLQRCAWGLPVVVTVIHEVVGYPWGYGLCKCRRQSTRQRHMHFRVLSTIHEPVWCTSHDITLGEIANVQVGLDPQ